MYPDMFETEAKALLRGNDLVLLERFLAKMSTFDEDEIIFMKLTGAKFPLERQAKRTTWRKLYEDLTKLYQVYGKYLLDPDNKYYSNNVFVATAEVEKNVSFSRNRRVYLIEYGLLTTLKDIYCIDDMKNIIVEFGFLDESNWKNGEQRSTIISHNDVLIVYRRMDGQFLVTLNKSENGPFTDLDTKKWLYKMLAHK